MMRLTVLLLALLNLVYLAWGQGWLAAYGWVPAPTREPQRLLQQVNPEAIRLVDTALLTAKPDAAPASLSCLITPELSASERDVVKAAAQKALPPGSWVIEEQAAAAHYVVYMGPYASQTDLDSKREQLKRLGLGFQVLGNAAQTPGLSLGSYATQAEAQSALTGFVAKGVRSAQVLQMALPGRSWRLRLPAVDVPLLIKLPELASALPGQGLMPCAPAPTARP
jgi:hypothetical protein